MTFLSGEVVITLLLPVNKQKDYNNFEIKTKEVRDFMILLVKLYFLCSVCHNHFAVLT